MSSSQTRSTVSRTTATATPGSVPDLAAAGARVVDDLGRVSSSIVARRSGPRPATPGGRRRPARRRGRTTSTPCASPAASDRAPRRHLAEEEVGCRRGRRRRSRTGCPGRGRRQPAAEGRRAQAKRYDRRRAVRVLGLEQPLGRHPEHPVGGDGDGDVVVRRAGVLGAVGVEDLVGPVLADDAGDPLVRARRRRAARPSSITVKRRNSSAVVPVRRSTPAAEPSATASRGWRGSTTPSTHGLERQQRTRGAAEAAEAAGRHLLLGLEQALERRGRAGRRSVTPAAAATPTAVASASAAGWTAWAGARLGDAPGGTGRRRRACRAGCRCSCRRPTRRRP